MALMNLSERPALAVRLGEQEDIKASQDQILLARIHDLEVKAAEREVKAAERDETIMYLMQQLRETEILKVETPKVKSKSVASLPMTSEKSIHYLSGLNEDYEDRADTTRGIPLEDLNLSQVGAVKELDNWLTANQLNTSDPIVVIVYVKKLTTWMSMSGQGGAWRFIDVSLVDGFREFLEDVMKCALNPDLTLEYYYHKREASFIVDFVAYIKYENGISDKEYLGLTKMNPTKVFLGFEARDYIRTFRNELSRMPGINPLDATTVFLMGIHPKISKLLREEFPYIGGLQFDAVRQMAIQKIKDVETQNKLNLRHGKTDQPGISAGGNAWNVGADRGGRGNSGGGSETPYLGRFAKKRRVG